MGPKDGKEKIKKKKDYYYYYYFFFESYYFTFTWRIDSSYNFHVPLNKKTLVEFNGSCSSWLHVHPFTYSALRVD